MEEYEEREDEEEEEEGVTEGEMGPDASLLCVEYPGVVVRQAWQLGHTFFVRKKLRRHYRTLPSCYVTSVNPDSTGSGNFWIGRIRIRDKKRPFLM
jgi:hypothetical protein